MQVKEDRSFGIIPIREKQGVIELLIVKHLGGHWSFPKGHPEPGESPQQTATRELLEETGLSVSSFLEMSPFEEEYTFYHRQQKIHKKVSYYPAYVDGTERKQEEEIIDLLWGDLASCIEKLTFKQAREFCIRLQDQMPILKQKIRNKSHEKR